MRTKVQMQKFKRTLLGGMAIHFTRELKQRLAHNVVSQTLITNNFRRNMTVIQVKSR